MFYPWIFGYDREITYYGWWGTTNGKLDIISGCYDIKVVTDASTYKDILNLFWDKLDLTPALCCVWSVSWSEVWAYI